MGHDYPVSGQREAGNAETRSATRGQPASRTGADLPAPPMSSGPPDPIGQKSEEEDRGSGQGTAQICRVCQPTEKFCPAATVLAVVIPGGPSFLPLASESPQTEAPELPLPKPDDMNHMQEALGTGA